MFICYCFQVIVGIRNNIDSNKLTDFIKCFPLAASMLFFGCNYIILIIYKYELI